MFILKKGHQPGVYVPLRALFLVYLYLQSKSLIVITVLFMLPADFVGWDSYISLILNNYQNIYHI